jgi:hypothetical protein
VIDARYTRDVRSGPPCGPDSGVQKLLRADGPVQPLPVAQATGEQANPRRAGPQGNAVADFFRENWGFAVSGVASKSRTPTEQTDHVSA